MYSLKKYTDPDDLGIRPATVSHFAPITQTSCTAMHGIRIGHIGQFPVSPIWEIQDTATFVWLVLTLKKKKRMFLPVFHSRHTATSHSPLRESLGVTQTHNTQPWCGSRAVYRRPESAPRTVRLPAAPRPVHRPGRLNERTQGRGAASAAESPGREIQKYRQPVAEGESFVS